MGKRLLGFFFFIGASTGSSQVQVKPKLRHNCFYRVGLGRRFGPNLGPEGARREHVEKSLPCVVLGSVHIDGIKNYKEGLAILLAGMKEKDKEGH